MDRVLHPSAQRVLRISRLIQFQITSERKNVRVLLDTQEKMVENEFPTDPSIGHRCIPYRTTQDRMQRILYEVPLLHAITTRKTVANYRRIFCALKDELTDLEAGSGLRIVLDYGKAATAAAQNIFSESEEGCGWHLSQAWTRKRNSLGLRQFIVGKKRCRNIARWWNTIKGIPFLPEDLVRRVPAIYHPPVPESHTAYMKCLEFISYLHTVWLDGPFKGLWCKWKVEEVLPPTSPKLSTGTKRQTIYASSLS
ncbi:hypothetical protein OESDEN_02309 [Oesophagostomum dentatum]|uniref:MULE transposase domain-containing protein n=1 Tax=Oesophagostomum dentatum TaxID=61180 RepID=A0A0B1TNQ3_OESDE|nr:hypothetical protein OESDEN_02309 [Oesophagostomum dentatum]